MLLRDTLRVNGEGHLEIGGCDAVRLAGKYGTPLYVMDESYIRAMAKVYTDALKTYYGEGTALYASKAFCCKGIYPIVGEFGMGADVVSGGELYTALSAGFPAEKIYFHGNNKSLAELKYALESGVGRIVVDGLDEIALLDGVCAGLGVRRKVLLRVNPGVEAHTHHYIQTARLDSKFGLAIDKGYAEAGVAAIADSANLEYAGLHCHIGSQIFEKEAFAAAVDRMTDFMLLLARGRGLETRELNMGGGFGVWYAEGDARLVPPHYAEFVRVMAEAVLSAVRDKGLAKPRLLIEPGRSMVAGAGVTLYTVGNVKEIAGVKKYVAVDGGMFENPRYALYQAKYTAVCANRMDEPHDDCVTLAGKCCESGDVLIEHAMLPRVCRGDVVAVLGTGAYNYSMASNYNRNPVPPVVRVSDGVSSYLVRPQTFEDLTRNDV